MSSKSRHEEIQARLMEYIDAFWDKIIHAPKPRGNPNFLPLKFSYVTPNVGLYDYAFYWDSYFIFQGLLRTKREWVMPEMVENFSALFQEHGIIPNFNHPAALNRSQPPLFTSMILDGYDVLKRNKHISPAIQQLNLTPEQWLEKHAKIASQEYGEVWQGEVKVYGYNHFVPAYHLNRYGNRDGGDAFYSEFESGWDLTSRFYNRCNDFLPIDLNCFLFKYEQDLAYIHKLLGHLDEAKLWEKRSIKRKAQINSLMWNESAGFFYDYDYTNKTQSTFHSLAGFIPLWVGLATPTQAKKMLRKLMLFETQYGLTITDEASLASRPDLSSIPSPYRLSIRRDLQPKQWDWPHIWPPLEYLVVLGLLNYGFSEAYRIMQKAVNANLKIYEKSGVLLEKLDATTGGRAKDFHYPNQEGFGWTNAVVYRYIEMLKGVDKDLYLT